MHKLTCQCPQCNTGTRSEFETLAFDTSPQGEYEDEYEEEYEGEGEFEGEYADEASFGARDAESPFSEEEEAELAMELLSVTSDTELDEFLGKLFKKIGRGIKKIARPLGGALKGLAKKALPFVGGALGSFIPIPGVGTAVGTALGSAVGNALEAEFGELEVDEQEFEMARRFVRIAGTAAQQAAGAGGSADPRRTVQAAVTRAARQHVPGLGQRRRGGRWVRRGNAIVVVGV